jgi:hypothetical protein
MNRPIHDHTNRSTANRFQNSKTNATKEKSALSQHSAPLRACASCSPSERASDHPKHLVFPPEAPKPYTKPFAKQRRPKHPISATASSDLAQMRNGGHRRVAERDFYRAEWKSKRAEIARRGRIREDGHKPPSEWPKEMTRDVAVLQVFCSDCIQYKVLRLVLRVHKYIRCTVYDETPTFPGFVPRLPPFRSFVPRFRSQFYFCKLR